MHVSFHCWRIRISKFYHSKRNSNQTITFIVKERLFWCLNWRFKLEKWLWKLVSRLIVELLNLLSQRKYIKNSALLGSNKNMLESNRNIKEFHTDNNIQQWKALSLSKPKHKNQIKSLILHHVLKCVMYVMLYTPMPIFTNPVLD